MSSSTKSPALESQFRVLRAGIPEERRLWVDAWQRWPDREVFAHPGYLEAMSPDDDHQPLCAHMSSADGDVLYPFYLRPVPGASESTGLSDVTSPYGYGGPFFWGDCENEPLSKSFWNACDAWFAENRVVSEFVRLSLRPEQRISYPGKTEQRLLNVVRSLDLDEETMWSDFKHKVRKNVNRARRDGLTVEVDQQGERLDAFVHIYHLTMQRCNAESSYHYSAEFFAQLTQAIPGQFAFFHAMFQGEVAASELVLVSSHAVYSFLGGTDEKYFASRPNDLLKFEVMRWAKSVGKDRFVLGGGKSATDGIFRYKEAFAPDGVIPFYTGTRVLDQDAYDGLVEQSSSGQDSDFFPLYRAA